MFLLLPPLPGSNSEARSTFTMNEAKLLKIFFFFFLRTACSCNFLNVNGDAGYDRACIQDIKKKHKTNKKTPTKYTGMKHFIPFLSAAFVLTCYKLRKRWGGSS